MFKKKINWRTIIKAAQILGLCFLAGIAGMVVLVFYYTYDLPRPEKFTESPFIQSTKIYDRTGKVLLYDIYGEEKRQVISFEKIPEVMKNAVIAAEDANFYSHKGLDFKGIARAILVDLKLKAPSQGASTITQQLVRTTFLTWKKLLSRKVREIVLTLELERRYSKDEILDWYLNAIPFGENTYGVESAAQTYFNKSITDVSLAEAATLTAMIPNASYYSPYREASKKRLLERKDNYVLDRMQKLGYITEQQAKEAKEEQIEFSNVIRPIKAPHFVMYVKKYLVSKYGEDYLKEKGLKVYTTLDWDLQELAQNVVAQRDETNVKFNGNNTALVAQNPKTGEILALIGSKSFFQDPYPIGCEEQGPGKCLFDPEFDVATMGERQPGSSFKPFVYATAFKKGYTADTVVFDAKTEFNPNCNPYGTQEKDAYGADCYHPNNYDMKFRGKITLKSALAQSLNAPSVKTLYLAGINESLQTAKDMGITTLTTPERYGLSLVLGGGEVNLLEMTSAYGVFATEGVKIDPVSILKIEDSNGNIIEQNNKQSTKVLDTQIARQINDILSDNNARSPMFGQHSQLYFPGYQVAAKTGTTQNYKDAWTIGYTPFAVVGVWVGNSDNSPIKEGTGIGLASPIWQKVMQKLLETNLQQNFTKPDPVQITNPILLGQFPDNGNHSILYYINKDDPKGAPILGQTSDAQYPFWEAGVQNWLASH